MRLVSQMIKDNIQGIKELHYAQKLYHGPDSRQQPWHSVWRHRLYTKNYAASVHASLFTFSVL